MQKLHRINLKKREIASAEEKDKEEDESREEENKERIISMDLGLANLATTIKINSMMISIHILSLLKC